MEDTIIPKEISVKKSNRFSILHYTLFIFHSVIFTAFAQKLEIGSGIGNLQYKGDLYPAYRPFEMNPGANLFVRYNLSRAVSLKLNGIAGYLWVKDKRVDNPINQLRNFSFERDIEETALQIEYNFLNFRTTASRIRSNWTPYVFAAYALSHARQSILTNQSIGGVPSRATKNRDTEYAIPFGIGFKKQFRDKWNWGVEFGARKMFTDRFDGFGYYTDNGTKTYTFEAAYSTAPNPLDRKIYTPTTRLNDMYFYTNIFVSYVFYKVHCPKRR